jgi:hypothetical protein
MAKPKTLGDYVYEGKHELVAFVRDSRNIDVHDEDSTTQGNRLGISHLGVLVCDRKTDGDCAHFFYKVNPKERMADIARASISYNYSTVVSEFPLAISSKNLFGWNFANGNEVEMYQEAKRILSEHGLY